MKRWQTIVGFHVIDVKDNNYLNDTQIDAMRAWIESITSEDISVEHFEFSDNAIKRLADSLGYESVYQETGRVIILPDGRKVFPCVVNNRFENGCLTHPFIRLTTSYHDDDIKVEFTCLYKYIDYDQLPKVLTNKITKIDGFKDITLEHNDYFNDEQIKVITEWIKGIRGDELVGEFLEVTDKAILRLNKVLGYTSVESINYPMTESPEGIEICPQVWAEIDDDTDEYRGDATIKLIHTGDKEINVLFRCNLKYTEVEDNRELNKMLTLTKKEAFKRIKAHEEFEKYYYFDGSPKVKEVGTEAVELICNFYFNDEQVKIIKSWVESITGFETINEWDIPYVDIIDDEIERLADMLGGEIIDDHIDKRILIGDVEIYVELDDDDEEFTLTIHQYNHNRENHTLITFSGGFVYEEIRNLKLKELK